MAKRTPFWLDDETGVTLFPPTQLALRDPNGLLAVGGDLSPERLLAAYRRGIFPWYSEGQPILWWTPDPRAVLFPSRLHLSRRLRRTLRREPFRVTLDEAFAGVMEACAQPRKEGPGTWITPAMMEAYLRLHRLGHAHSIECWADGDLVGGLYGIAIGQAFFGESMFSRRTDASKVALAYLVKQLEAWGFGLLDCQVSSPHMTTLGATTLPRRDFERLLDRLCDQPGRPGPWRMERTAPPGWGEAPDQP